jgi:endonuclease YncB( thermonuclease family)
MYLLNIIHLLVLLYKNNKIETVFLYSSIDNTSRMSIFNSCFRISDRSCCSSSIWNKICCFNTSSTPKYVIKPNLTINDKYTLFNESNVSDYDNATWENTIGFVPPVSTGKVIKVYDGDTITIASKLPYIDSVIYRFSVRLIGIDAPEIKGSTDIEKTLAILSRDALHKLIFGKIVRLEDVGTEKYGRLLANVYLDDINVSEWMIKNGYAIAYNGGKKMKPNDWEG